MKKILLSMILITSINLPFLNTHAMNFSVNETFLKDASKALIIGAATSYFTYKTVCFGYNKINEYLENRLIDETASSIELALTPKYHLKLLPPAKFKAALRKKAQLINVRKRVLSALQDKMGDSSLSIEHKKRIENKLKVGNPAFIIIDAIRVKNPYEDEYEKASIIDKYLEKRILDSIILAEKPIEECTQNELAQKELMNVRRNKIIAKLCYKMGDVMLEQLRKLDMFLFLYSPF